MIHLHMSMDRVWLSSIDHLPSARPLRWSTSPCTICRSAICTTPAEWLRQTRSVVLSGPCLPSQRYVCLPLHAALLAPSHAASCRPVALSSCQPFLRTCRPRAAPSPHSLVTVSFSVALRGILHCFFLLMDAQNSRDHAAENAVMVSADALEPPVETSACLQHLLSPSNFRDTLRDHYRFLISCLRPDMLPPLDPHRQSMPLNRDVFASHLSYRSTSSPFSDTHTDIDINEEPLQNHLSRHSPPVQPNEQQPGNVGLPSFSQVKFPKRAIMIRTNPLHSS